MSSKNGVGQVIKTPATVMTFRTLTGGFRIIKAALDYRSRLTKGTLYTIGPAQLTNGLITRSNSNFGPQDVLSLGLSLRASLDSSLDSSLSP